MLVNAKKSGFREIDLKNSLEHWSGDAPRRETIAVYPRGQYTKFGISTGIQFTNRACTVLRPPAPPFPAAPRHQTGSGPLQTTPADQTASELPNGSRNWAPSGETARIPTLPAILPVSECFFAPDLDEFCRISLFFVREK